MLVKDSSVISISNSIFEGNYDGVSNEINSAVLISSYSPSSLTVYDSIFRNNLQNGAVRLIGVGINSFFSNCEFSDNLNHVGGAALYLESVYAAVIENSVFRNNEYQSLNDSSSELGGGAIFQRQSVLITTNCSFVNNRAHGGMGGAILTTHSTIYNSKADVFYNNTARIGGALATLDTNAFLSSTIGLSKFHYNSATILGGAIFVFKCKHIHVEDLTQFVGNSANYGGAIYGVNTKVRIYDHQDILFKDNYEMGPNGEKLVSNLKSFPDAFDMNITDSNNLNTNFNFNFGETVNLVFDLKTNSYSYYMNSDSISIDNNLIHVDIQVSGGAVIDFGDSSYKKNKKATFYSYSKVRNPFSFTVTLSFTTLKLFSYSTTKSFTIEPTECKPNYWYDLVIQSQNNHQSVYGCGFSWLSILPFIFLGVFIISIIVIVISIFAFFKIRKMKSKLKILDKKEQAEVELNQRLIQLEQLYTSEVQNKYYMKDWMIKIENIKIISKIGEGGMGIVYRGIFSMHEVALKTVKIDSDDLESNEFEREASILSSMRHPNIVGFYGVCVTDTTRFMVTEYMSGGSLDSLIYKCKIKTRHITIPTKISILLGIANGMNYLHTGKSDITIHHRDLKPANILLTNDLIPKVCDFGLSKLSKDSGKSSKTTNIGTLYFIAPEMLLGKDYNYTIDVFSFSIIMWQLIFDETQLYDSSYATNPKFSTFMRSEEIKQFAKLVDSSYILVPKLVTEGLRLPIPKIPIDSIELREWIFEYFVNDDAKMEMQMREDSLERYSNGLSALFELMQKCWQESITERPSFHKIAKELESIKNMFK